MTTSAPPPTPMPPAGYSMQPQGGNGAALASLICSILGFCVLFLGGLLGIILGVMGLRRARETGTSSGMATAGIVVGVLSLLTSIVFVAIGLSGYFVGKAAYNAFKEEGAVARQYVMDVSQGNTDAALAESSGISREEVAAENAALQPLGKFLDMTSSNFSQVNNVMTLRGTATFANGTKDYTVVLTKSGTTWKITSVTFP